MNKIILSMIMFLSVTSVQAMDPAEKAIVNTYSCMGAIHAICVDLATSNIVTENKKKYPELALPIYSSSIAPVFGAVSLGACTTDHTATGLFFAQQSVYFAYMRRAFINTAVENIVIKKKIKALNN